MSLTEKPPQYPAGDWSCDKLMTILRSDVEKHARRISKMKIFGRQI
jgi:hypothetical protein